MFASDNFCTEKSIHATAAILIRHLAIAARSAGSDTFDKVLTNVDKETYNSEVASYNPNTSVMCRSVLPGSPYFTKYRFKPLGSRRRQANHLTR
jgi:hypothetical protein